MLVEFSLDRIRFNYKGKRNKLKKENRIYSSFISNNYANIS